MNVHSLRDGMTDSVHGGAARPVSRAGLDGGQRPKSQSGGTRRNVRAANDSAELSGLEGTEPVDDEEIQRANEGLGDLDMSAISRDDSSSGSLLTDF